MKLTSTCERQFITNCVTKQQKRLDGRQLQQGRTLEIVFGKERGCCMVLLGNTRILAQVSCEITEPKGSTPTEGTLHVNLELSPMSAPDAKSQSRSSEEAVEAQRSLERCIRDSKAVDLESLCIITGSKVWTIRVDIHTLNDDGNVVESASIAAVSALAHFRRPEVTVVGTDVTVHSVEEKEPVALNLHHMPISINFALFDQGKYILFDPTEVEERICDGCYIIGMNAHQEICYVHRRGVLLLTIDAIHRCEDAAVRRAQEVTKVIRAALDDDSYKRATNAPVGFTNLIETDTILGAKRPMEEINLDSVKSLEINTEPDILELPGDNDSSEDLDNIKRINGHNKTSVIAHVNSTAKEKALSILQRECTVFEGGPSKWGEEMSDDEDDDISEVECTNVQPEDAVKEEVSLDTKEALYVHEEELDVKAGSRKWYSRDVFE